MATLDATMPSGRGRGRGRGKGFGGGRPSRWSQLERQVDAAAGEDLEQSVPAALVATAPRSCDVMRILQLLPRPVATVRSSAAPIDTHNLRQCLSQLRVHLSTRPRGQAAIRFLGHAHTMYSAHTKWSSQSSTALAAKTGLERKGVLRSTRRMATTSHCALVDSTVKLQARRFSYCVSRAHAFRIPPASPGLKQKFLRVRRCRCHATGQLSGGSVPIATSCQGCFLPRSRPPR